jgi:hypothetical protein
VTEQHRDHSSRGSFWRRKRLWALLGVLIVAALVGGVVEGTLGGKHHGLPKRYVKLQKDIEIAGSSSAIGDTNFGSFFSPATMMAQVNSWTRGSDWKPWTHSILDLFEQCMI